MKWISGWTLPAIGRSCKHQNSQAGAFCEGVRATTTNPLSLHTGHRAASFEVQNFRLGYFLRNLVQPLNLTDEQSDAQRGHTSS